MGDVDDVGAGRPFDAGVPRIPVFGHRLSGGPAVQADARRVHDPEHAVHR